MVQDLETREELELQYRNLFKKGECAVESDLEKSWSGIEMEVGVE